MVGEEQVLYSADLVILEAGADINFSEGRCHTQSTEYPPEFLRSLKASGLPLGELHLKVGCPVKYSATKFISLSRSVQRYPFDYLTYL